MSGAFGLAGYHFGTSPTRITGIPLPHLLYYQVASPPHHPPKPL